MTEGEILGVFRAQTENVRELDQAWKHLQRTINSAIIKNPTPSLEIHTKLQALIFCAWAEANFSKLVHTPYGFSPSEIIQIKSAASSSIGNGWLKCLELGLLRITSPKKSSYIPNIRRKVSKIIKEYVVSPSLIRNKISHGQWRCALNRSNTKTNTTLTAEIQSLDTVKLSIWKDAYKCLSNIIEALIESPDRSFHKDYWVEISHLDQLFEKKNKFNIDDKTKLLKEKASHYNLKK